MQPYDDLKLGLEQAIEGEITKYKKKTKSNTSKSKAKADHKHDSVECLFISKDRPYLGWYCSKCGKIINWTVPVFTKEEAGARRMMTDEEVYEKFKDLKRIQVENMWQKYIPITIE